ncbi:unnamed protein product [Rotaria sordida]|uniref:Hexosyltransferase n=1 Tax=Rotaria sordida TaxID=392033 RepID=A0A818YQ97_9BILA|nr:unnamed protein product [Rotaria sordida]CAF1425600.1 unnamed protein product [Rotaria sordida]CAF3753049.1 unnamed protein product [Rotaria sordida]CAF3988253.1 unnamed protein product [Rotaria sordida]
MPTRYYGRRRFLKILLISVILSLIFVVIFLRRQGIFLFSQFLYGLHFSYLNNSKEVSNHIILQPAPTTVLQISLSSLKPLQKTQKGVLSSIEFINPVFLNLESESSNIIPIIVLSNASNIEARDAIRRTWGYDQLYQNNKIQIRVFFLVGIEDFMMKRIHAEQLLFDDVIQVHIPDMYSFIAYRELSAMLWVRSYLPRASFYIKTEDNVIINMKFIINKFLPTIERTTNKNIVIGWFGSEHSIPRGRYQKFINIVLPPSDFNLQYAMSLLYIVTSRASDRMLDAISHVNRIEHPGDPFVTGILRDVAHVQIKNLATSPENYSYKLSNETCGKALETNSKLLFCTSPLLIKSVDEYFKAWHILLSQN